MPTQLQPQHKNVPPSSKPSSKLHKLLPLMLVTTELSLTQKLRSPTLRLPLLTLKTALLLPKLLQLTLLQ